MNAKSLYGACWCVMSLGDFGFEQYTQKRSCLREYYCTGEGQQFAVGCQCCFVPHVCLALKACNTKPPPLHNSTPFKMIYLQRERMTGGQIRTHRWRCSSSQRQAEDQAGGGGGGEDSAGVFFFLLASRLFFRKERGQPVGLDVEEMQMCGEGRSPASSQHTHTHTRTPMKDSPTCEQS